MSIKRIFDAHDISRANYLWLESKTRINIALSATVILALLAVIAFL